MLDSIGLQRFLRLVIMLVVLCLREWVLLLARKKLAILRESDPVWLPEYVLTEQKPWSFLSALALSLALLKEWSGEAAVERAARSQSLKCDGLVNGSPHQTRIHLLGLDDRATSQRLYTETLERRYRGVNRCC